MVANVQRSSDGSSYRIVQSMKEIEVVLPEDAKREKVMKEIETSLSDTRCSGSPSQRSPVGIPCAESPTWSWVLRRASASSGFGSLSPDGAVR